jgi:hypothetical protein
MSGDIVERLRRAHQALPIPSIASLYSDAADLLEAIDALHQPVPFGKGNEACDECVCFWPCDTHLLLHPEGGPS